MMFLTRSLEVWPEAPAFDEHASIADLNDVGHHRGDLRAQKPVARRTEYIDIVVSFLFVKHLNFNCYCTMQVEDTPLVNGAI
jgi:hypothetical protein